MKNVICIKWGEKYGPEYVNNLYHMVKRNLTLSHRFVCFTDNVKGFDKNIEVFPLPSIYVPEKDKISPWQKLGILSERLGDLSGQALFLDLDIVIVDSLDPFFELKGKFCIIENWSQKGKGIGNSSVFRFEVGAHADILSYYNQHVDEVVSDYLNEQDFISKKISDLTYWPEEWCRSFKYDCLPKFPLRYFITPKIPKAAKIIVFHGTPNPHEAILGVWPQKGIRKFVKPTKWIKDYWNVAA